MSQELLFELDNVRVTPYLAQFGATSYQIASISSVRALQHLPPSLCSSLFQGEFTS